MIKPAPVDQAWASTINRMVVAGVGGGLTGAAVLTGWWLAAIVGSVAVAVATFGRPPSRRLAIGTAAGALHAAIVTQWTLPFTVAGTMALTLLQAAGWGLAALGVTRRARWPWAFAPALAVTEWARAQWPLGGYPLGQLWLTQADSPVAALAPLVGPFAVTAVLVLVGTAGLAALRRQPAAIGVLAAMVVLIAGAQWLPVPPSEDMIEVAAVQAGDRRGIPAVHDDPAPRRQRQIDLTRALAPGVDLAVWPESAVAVSGPLDDRDRGQLQELAAGFDGVLIAGLVERFDAAAGAGWFHNAAVAIDATGQLDRYDKQIPVPFGERVPARRLLTRFVDLSLVPRDMVVGDGPPILRTDLADIGVAISYENLFPRISRDAARVGADLLVVPTLASSYVTDEIPTQQLAAARMRAREAGRDLAIVGSTGPTALIQADGDIADRAPLDDPHVARATLHLRSGATVYSRYGDAPLIVAAGLIALLGLVRRWSPCASRSLS